MLVVVFAACQRQPPAKPEQLAIATARPTVDPSDSMALCESVDILWGVDWNGVIASLTALRDLDALCDGWTSTSQQLYAAYIGYGTLLEQRGRQSEAIDAYETALSFNFNGQEAVQRLRQLNIFTPEPPPACEGAVVEDIFSLMKPYEATSGEFVRVQGSQLWLGDAPYHIYGINYYPRDFPNERFLTQMNVEMVDFELDLIRASGINTLRVFLRYDDLFVCPGNGAIPIPANFDRLDKLILRAAERGFRLILVLNHDADLVVFPLYDSPEHTMAQMSYIVQRYKDEPAVIAYDVRDGGDADYAANAALATPFEREEVLAWLSETIQLVKANAPNQLVTAAFWDDALATIPLVDFVSFHNSGTTVSLRQEIATLKAETTRPVLLADVSFDTFHQDEFGQRQSLQRVLEAVEQNGLVGWVITTAFDYPLSVLCNEPGCLADDSPENRSGLWNTSYFAKRAVEVIEQFTGVAEEQLPES